MSLKKTVKESVVRYIHRRGSWSFKVMSINFWMEFFPSPHTMYNFSRTAKIISVTFTSCSLNYFVKKMWFVFGKKISQFYCRELDQSSLHFHWTNNCLYTFESKKENNISLCSLSRFFSHARMMIISNVNISFLIALFPFRNIYWPLV